MASTRCNRSAERGGRVMMQRPSVLSVRLQPRNESEFRLYGRAILVAVIGNMALTMAKGVVAWSSGSSAVLAEAVNSLSDVLYSLFMGLGLWLSQRPADESHPQGHGRFEPLVGVIIAVAMGFTGFEVVQQAVNRLLDGAASIEPGWPTVVLVGSAVLKLIMFALTRRLGEQTGSPAIQATARDNLSDVCTSAAALLGVWASRYLHPLFDPGAGLFVSVWVFRAAFEVLRENLGYLTGRGADAELIGSIVARAMTIPGVQGVHQVVADYVGPKVRVDMHIDVDGTISLAEAHEISDRVEECVEQLKVVDQAFVHVEPASGRRRMKTWPRMHDL
jgi:cation diffusion facilitator family transporter